MMIEYEYTITVEDHRRELEHRYGSIENLKRRGSRPNATRREKNDLDEWVHLFSDGANPEEPIKTRHGIMLHDPRAFFDVITPQRLRILGELRSGHVYESIHELAKALKRDPKNVHQDVTALAEKGLLMIHRRNKRRSVPKPAVDKIVITM